MYVGCLCCLGLGWSVRISVGAFCGRLRRYRALRVLNVRLILRCLLEADAVDFYSANGPFEAKLLFGEEA